MGGSVTIQIKGIKRLQELAAKFQRVGGNLDDATKSLAEVAFAKTKNTFSASTDPYGRGWKKLSPAYAKWKKNNARGDKPIGELYTTMWNKFRDGGLNADATSFTLTFDVDYSGYFHKSRPLLPTKKGLPKKWMVEFDEAMRSYILEMTR